MNTASIYDSAMAGLQYAQAGMVATSQNVTGSNVAGYVRRNPNLQISTMSPSSVEAGGTAFSVEGFTRNFNALLQGAIAVPTKQDQFYCHPDSGGLHLGRDVGRSSCIDCEGVGELFQCGGVAGQ